MGTQAPVKFHTSEQPDLCWAYSFNGEDLIGSNRKNCVTRLSSEWPRNASLYLYTLEGEYWVPKVYVPKNLVCDKCFKSVQSQWDLHVMSSERPKFLSQMWCDDCYDDHHNNSWREIPIAKEIDQFLLDPTFSWYAKK